MARPKTTVAKAVLHENLMPLLEAMQKEFQEQTKKKPDAVLSPGKVKVVNRLLSDILKIIDGEPTRPYIDLLVEDDLPQNSDVALMLGQVTAAMNAFRSKYYYMDSNTFTSQWSL